MEKKKYIKPQNETFLFSAESLMLTASPGVSSGEFDPSTEEIGTREQSGFVDSNFGSDDELHRSIWGD